MDKVSTCEWWCIHLYHREAISHRSYCSQIHRSNCNTPYYRFRHIVDYYTHCPDNESATSRDISRSAAGIPHCTFFVPNYNWQREQTYIPCLPPRLHLRLEGFVGLILDIEKTFTRHSIRSALISEAKMTKIGYIFAFSNS